jgi:rubrerythrin
MTQTVSSALLDEARLAAIDPAFDLSVLSSALAFEHEGIAAYRLAGASGLLQPETLAVAQIFMGHHEQHRDALATLVRKAGGAPVEPKPDADYVRDLHLEALKSQADVVALATRLEREAAKGYTDQIAALQDPHLARLFGEISADEAVHWAILNNAAGAAIPKTGLIFR